MWMKIWINFYFYRFHKILWLIRELYSLQLSFIEQMANKLSHQTWLDQMQLKSILMQNILMLMVNSENTKIARTQSSNECDEK